MIISQLVLHITFPKFGHDVFLMAIVPLPLSSVNGKDMHSVTCFFQSGLVVKKCFYGQYFWGYGQNLWGALKTDLL